MDISGAAKPAGDSGRGPRAMVVLRDQDSEGVVRQALSDLGADDTVFTIGNAAAALAAVSGRHSPELLIVDVSEEADPVDRVRDLVGACEPTTNVVVVGETNDIRLYRELKLAGAAEYFFKPLVTATVARTCRAILSEGYQQPQSRTGRLVFVAGVRGGVGGTTVAVRTALRLSEHPPRPVMMLDLDVQGGDAALQLDTTPNQALTEALERAERVDDLFLERGIIHVTDRLDLLASLAPVEQPASFRDEAVVTLLDILTRRYRYVVVDVPAHMAVALWPALHLPSTLLLVSDARLVGARDVARWREAIGPNSAERTTLQVLNMAGAPGSLQVEEFARGAGQPPDVVIPYSRELAAASRFGARRQGDWGVLDHGLGPVFRHLTGEPEEPSRPSLLKRMVGAR